MSAAAKLPVGGSMPFNLTLKTDGVADDVSAASEIELALTTGDDASRSLVGARVTADSGHGGADWSAGVITGSLPTSMTEDIGHYGLVDLQIKVTIGSERIYYFVDEAIELVSAA